MKVFGHHVYMPFVLLMGLEFVLAAGAFAVSMRWFQTDDGAVAPRLLGLWTVIFAVAVVLGAAAVGLYQGKQRLRIQGVLVRVAVAVAMTAVLVTVLDRLFPVGIEAWPVIASCVLCLVLLTGARWLLMDWVDHDAFRRRVLVLGAGERAANLLKLRRKSDQRGFTLVAFVPAEGDSGTLADERVVPVTGSLLEYAQANGVDEIVVAMDERRRGFPVAELLKCKFAGIRVTDLLAFLERETGRVKVDLVNPSWLIFSEGYETSARTQIISRAFDLACATALLMITWPLMVIAALAILVEDGRPVLYRQERVGFLGRIFTLYKFRSMIVTAEADGKAKWAKTGDQRVTRIGKWLRKLRIDELPQLLNVLRGEMSLVGPRPERPQFVEQLARTVPYYHERHVVKPGLAGWAQLCYPYGSSDHDAMEKLQFDLYYIKHKSLIFDLVVLLQTAEVVFWGKGAR